MVANMTCGVIFIHSAPRALCPHLEWAVGGVLGRPVSFTWEEQTVLPGSRRAEFFWEAPSGTGAALASALRGWEHLRYEITEDRSANSDAGRWMHTPDLGIHFARTDAAGNIVVTENALRTAVADAAGSPQEMTRQISVALGTAWDNELDVFRTTGEQTPVVWLHKVAN